MTAAAAAPRTAILMMNMGGPRTPDATGAFLKRLFSDGDIVQLGALQGTLGPFLAWRRTPAITKQYERIGGSPILEWTNTQGRAMVQRLDRLSPTTGPHKHYVAFRYADPLTEATLRSMVDDGVERVVAFSQYPQWSCTTAGSSVNHLSACIDKMGLRGRFQWSLIDRWYDSSLFIDAVISRIRIGMASFANSDGTTATTTAAAAATVASASASVDTSKHDDDGGGGDGGYRYSQDEQLPPPIIVFSAHSLPLKVVNRGDRYPVEVAATVDRVMSRLNQHLRADNGPHAVDGGAPPPFRHVLAWQSQVGSIPWLGPQTGDVLKALGASGHRRVLVVPIAFTSDHIETLFEIDIEYAHMATEAGITEFRRAPSLNDEPLLADAFADIVSRHLHSGTAYSEHYPLKCTSCRAPSRCRPQLV